MSSEYIRKKQKKTKISREKKIEKIPTNTDCHKLKKEIQTQTGRERERVRGIVKIRKELRIEKQNIVCESSETEREAM